MTAKSEEMLMKNFLFKIMAALTVFFIVFCVAAGAVVRGSYIQAPVNSEEILSIPLEQTNSQFEIASISKEKLLGADLIARVVFTGERKIEHMATRSTVSLLEVMKGNLKEGAQIDLYEYCFIRSNGQNFVLSNFSFSNLMQEGKEYIIFANQKKYNPVYQKKLNRLVYLPVSIEFPLCEMADVQSSVLDEEDVRAGQVKYADVKENEFLVTSAKQLSQLHELKAELFSALGVQAAN